MGNTDATVHRNTPDVMVQSNRGLVVLEIGYHRHPNSTEETQERITRHSYNSCGFLMRSADPRLGQKGLANFTYLNDLSGGRLRTNSVDAGTSIMLNDTASRPLLKLTSILIRDDGADDFTQAVTHTYEYEGVNLLGRPLSVSDQVAGGSAWITERFVYAGDSPANKRLNLVGQCICHYDPAGLLMSDSMSIAGCELSNTRRLLKDADLPDTLADWQGPDSSTWNKSLNNETYTSLNMPDATGKIRISIDAAGHQQRVEYQIAGEPKSCWLTVNAGHERPIMTAIAYSANGKKLHEVHGNGIVSTCRYDPRAQYLTALRTERPSGHKAGSKLLQELRYQYDPVGNVLLAEDASQQTRVWRNQNVVPENHYVYDSLYQLVSATGREMANAARQSSSMPRVLVPIPTDRDAYTNYVRTYRYDSACNLTQIVHTAPATGNSYTTLITVSDRSNRAVSDWFTENPNHVEDLFTPNGQQRQLTPGQILAWTTRGTLQMVAPIVRNGGTNDVERYLYDANSQRVLKASMQVSHNSTQRQRIVYLPSLELRVSFSGAVEKEQLQIISMSTSERAQARLLHWKSGKPPELSADAVRYSFGNLTGSVSLEVGDDGKVISIEEYYPYGGTSLWAARSATEASYKLVRYSGQERDATGLYYYGYRYYQPWCGRWLSADPAGTVDGLNLFTMVRNNPTGQIDALGLVLIIAQGLSEFPEDEIDKVLQALQDARNALDTVTQPDQDLLATEMKSFFGPNYAMETNQIINTWKTTNNLLAEYDTPYQGYPKFYRISQDASPTIAQVSLDDPESRIFIHDDFFLDELTDESRAAALIHEASHLEGVDSFQLPGAKTEDYYYLSDSTPLSDSFKKVVEGVLEEHQIKAPEAFFEQIAISNNMSIFGINENFMSYADGEGIQDLTLAEAVQVYNHVPSLRTKIASRNADNIAYSAMKMAARL
ncbi:RHS repeat-associated core domain-containing protein [Pseudomonas sp. NPDC089752]|uniref:RHS repeat-associated core domain-containing protein n=1 Tax=Pseudomonas sp. NPDC089752 TaxID=3364472 RepID=UPI0037FE354D